MSLNCRENIVNDLSTLESLIVTTRDYCMQKDFSNKVYEKAELSYERNNYMNKILKYFKISIIFLLFWFSVYC